MSLADTIRAAVAPPARRLVADVGSTVQVRRAVVSRAADNSEIRSWLVIASGDGVGCLIRDDVSGRTAQEWGLDRVVAALAVMPDTTDVQEMDGIIVTAGHRKGTHFRVLRVRPKPFGGLLQLALETTQESFT